MTKRIPKCQLFGLALFRHIFYISLYHEHDHGFRHFFFISHTHLQRLS